MTHHVAIQVGFQVRINPPAGQILQPQILVAIELRALIPGTQVGALAGVGGEQIVRRIDSDVAQRLATGA